MDLIINTNILKFSFLVSNHNLSILSDWNLKLPNFFKALCFEKKIKHLKHSTVHVFQHERLEVFHNFWKYIITHTFEISLIFLFVWNCNCAFTETVTESPADNFEMPHTTSTGCVTPSGLYGPAITTCFGGGISTLGACFFLNMKADTATTTAQSVCLVAPFTKRTCSLGLKYTEIYLD